MNLPKICATAVAIALTVFAATSRAEDVYSVRGPWVDDSERAYSLESLRGAYTVVTMAYGACQKVCSTSLRVVRRLAADAEARHLKLKIVVVGLEPSEDKPRDWAALRQEYRPDFQSVVFLTGTEPATRRLAKSIGVQYWRYGEHTMHDFKVVLVSPEGAIAKYIDRFDENPSILLP